MEKEKMRAESQIKNEAEKEWKLRSILPKAYNEIVGLAEPTWKWRMILIFSIHLSPPPPDYICSWFPTDYTPRVGRPWACNLWGEGQVDWED